jgi:hypothetical protein
MFVGVSWVIFIDARTRSRGIRQSAEPRERARREFATCSINFCERLFISRVLPRIVVASQIGASDPASEA